MTVLSACGSPDHSAAYTAAEIEASLEAQGLDVEAALDERPGGSNGSVFNLLDLYDLPGLRVVLADPGRDGAHGRKITAWIFDTERHADALRGGATRLQRSNVVLLTTKEHEKAAASALAALG